MEEDIKYLEDLIPFAKMLLTTSQRATIQEKEIEVLENIIARYKELEKLEDITYEVLKDTNLIHKYYISKSKIKEKIEELDRRIDYLDKELTEAYIVKEKLGTETDIDTNEQYIYNMEQEKSIRHTQKYAYLELLEE